MAVLHSFLFFFNRVEVCFHFKLLSTDLELFQQPGSNVDYSIVWHVTGWMARLSSSKMFLRSVVSHHLETCTHRKGLGFFSKKDLNEWINKWITVLQGENSSPLWMWSCRLPLHSPWLPWLPCVTALAGQQPKRLRYNLKFPPVPSSWWQETASVRRLSCGQEDKNASHHYVPPVIRPPRWNGGSWCQHLTVCSTLPSPNEATVQRWWAAQWIHLLVQ